MTYEKSFTVRWSEIDLNMHLTSAAYVKYITDVRMNFFEEHGFGLSEMKKYKMGPIVLWEKSYYFKEIRPGEKITIQLRNAGISEQGNIFRLEQRIYNSKGVNSFLAYTLFALMDGVTRKITQPHDIIVKAYENLPKSDTFRILAKEELRDPEAFPA